jgi:hypothetical protein
MSSLLGIVLLSSINACEMLCVADGLTTRNLVTQGPFRRTGHRRILEHAKGKADDGTFSVRDGRAGQKAKEGICTPDS